jgi:hypothetical protein
VLDIAKALTSRRRQRKTVSEWTMIRLSRHCGRQRENKIQNSRSQRRSTGDEFGCARAQRFDGAARSIPGAQEQRSEGSRFAAWGLRE